MEHNFKVQYLILIIVVIVLGGVIMWLWYGFSFTDENLSVEMNDNILKDKYIKNKHLLNQFSKSFIKEKKLFEIVVIDNRKVSLNNYAVIINMDKIPDNFDLTNKNNLKLYWSSLKKVDFMSASITYNRDNKPSYITYSGKGSFEVDYGLFYSPKDIKPKKLMKSIYYCQKITDKWYIYRAK